MAKGGDNVTNWIISLLIIVVLLVITLVIVGNLSGNLGFTSGSQGDNDSQAVISNFTAGVLTFGTFFNVLFTAAAIFGVLAIFLAVLLFLVKVTNKIRGKGSGGYGGEGGL